MKRMREKLHSQSGASILLALLLFLTCCMVAASILAAAASNAGKVRSSRVEQQKHLTLSSAIELVAGEIEQATYTGKYEVHEWSETYTVSTGEVDNEGKPITTTYTDYYFYVKQTPGDFFCGKLTGNPVSDLLPLGKELDGIFSRQFTGSGYEPLAAADIEDNSITHTLTVEVTNPPADSGTGSGAYAVPTKVTVQVTLNHSTRHITLTAWLGGGDAPPTDGSDTMCAELVAGDAPVLNYAPGGRIPNSNHPETGDERKTDPVTWQLNWIKKGAG